MQVLRGLGLRGVALAAAVMVTVAVAAYADLDLNERRWTRDCVGALPGATPRLRLAAGRGLSPFGTEAAPASVAATELLKSDSDWDDLAIALRTAAAGDGKAAADALTAQRAGWPAARRARLDALADALRGPAPTPIPPGEKDLDDGESRFVRTCLRGLASPGARVRLGATRALAPFGARAVPGMLNWIEALKTDEHWAAFREALDGMGALDCADALDTAKPSWPRTQAERLEDVVARLRVVGAGDRFDPEADKLVQELLAPFRGTDRVASNDPAYGKVRRVGRRAIPSLLRIVVDCSDDHTLVIAATCCLDGLLTDRDAPRLARTIVESGATPLAPLLAKIETTDATDGLVAVLEKGLMDHDVADALATRTDDARIPPLMVAWLESHRDAAEFELAAAAEVCRKLRVDAAVPRLLAILQAAAETQTRYQAAAALADLGSKEGIAGLIEVVAGQATGAGDVWFRHEAGRRLNNLSRTFSYRGGNDYSDQWEAKITAAADAAAPEFRTWWDGVKNTIRFDAESRTWKWE